MLAGAAAVGVAAALAAFGGRDSGQPEAERLAKAVAARAETSPAFVRAYGFKPDVVDSTCRKRGRFRGRRAYICDLELANGGTIDVCAALVDGRVYTGVETKGFRCKLPF